MIEVLFAVIPTVIIASSIGHAIGRSAAESRADRDYERIEALEAEVRKLEDKLMPNQVRLDYQNRLLEHFDTTLVKNEGDALCIFLDDRDALLLSDQNDEDSLVISYLKTYRRNKYWEGRQ